MLSGKKILLGISGGIASYKSATLIRLLTKSGANVQVIITPAVHQFITPLTLSTLSKNPVLSSFQDIHGLWNNHVDLGRWADAMIISPATANVIAKMSVGLCDNLLLATYLSTRCPVFIAPAMDLDMWQHPATQKNINQITLQGVLSIGPRKGELASGLTGIGRMAEPEEIQDFLISYFRKTNDLKGKKVLITAGPTYENIDPVRFIGNRSSGKMGYAIANEMALHGAHVHLISGPTQQTTYLPNITITHVESAEEMYQACILNFSTADISIFSSAISDYRPKKIASNKIKKQGTEYTLQLTQTPDIAYLLGQQKKPEQFIVGFALETENEIENAKKKLIKKNFDLIVLNSLKDFHAGFDHDTNKVTLINKSHHQKKIPLKSKKEVAIDIVQEIISQRHENHS